MVAYKYLVTDASEGAPIAEIPLTLDGSIPFVMNGAGQIQGSIPLDHPTTTRDVLLGDREITVLRDDEPVWNGPLEIGDVSRRSGTVPIIATEATSLLLSRVLEVDKNYPSGSDVSSDIIADLQFYAQHKTANGSDGMTLGDDIVADLPRWLSDFTTGVATTQDYNYFGSARHTIAEIFEELMTDLSTGFEYCMHYQSGTTRQKCRRTFTVGVPSLGVVKDEALREAVLWDWGRNYVQRQTRVHVVGSGYTKTLQSSSAVSAGLLLEEAVIGLSDVSDHGVINARAWDERRLRAGSGGDTFTATFAPEMCPLPYDWCQLGDTVTLDIDTPALLAISASRRVVQINLTPPQGSDPELVSLTFNSPLTDLGD